MNNNEFLVAKDLLNKASAALKSHYGEEHPHVRNCQYLIEKIDEQIRDSLTK